MADVFGIPAAVLSRFESGEGFQIELDALMSEAPSYRALITENPLEDGSVISDHTVTLPATLQIEGIFTDTPLGFLESLATGTAGLTVSQLSQSDAIAGAVGAAGAAALLGEIRPGLSKEKFKLLVALQVTRTPFKFVTGLQVYDNMLIENLSPRRSPEDGKSLRFSCSMKEVRFAGQQTPTNRQRIVKELWATAVSPEERGFVGRARAEFDPTEFTPSGQ